MFYCDYEDCPGLDYDSEALDFGEFHDECLDAQNEDEQRYWARVYGSGTPFSETVDLSAYERNDPKVFALEMEGY